MKTKGGGMAQTLLFNVCDAPKAQLGQIVSLVPARPFGTSQTPQSGVCANSPGESWKLLFAGTKPECL